MHENKIHMFSMTEKIKISLCKPGFSDDDTPMICFVIGSRQRKPNTQKAAWLLYFISKYIESVGALKFFPRVKLHEPAVALPVSSDISRERAAELGHRDAAGPGL